MIKNDQIFFQKIDSKLKQLPVIISSQGHETFLLSVKSVSIVL